MMDDWIIDHVLFQSAVTWNRGPGETVAVEVVGVGGTTAVIKVIR